MARAKKQSKQWHPEDIKAAVRKKGETLSSLARKNKMHESSVRNSLRTPITRGEKAISKFIGVPLHELWPDRWAENGKRIRPRDTKKIISANSNCKRGDKTKKTFNSSTENREAA